MMKWQDMTDTDKSKELLKRQSALELERTYYEATWDEIIEFINHSSKSINKSPQKGQKTGESVYDSTAIRARNLLSDGLNGYLVSPAMRWFSLKLPNTLEFPGWSGMRSWNGKRMDEMPEVKQWLEWCEEVLYSSFVRSNFYDRTPQIFSDGATIGTVDTYTEEDIITGKTSFTVPHVREIYIASDLYGRIDTVHRKYQVSVRNLVKKFGYDKLKAVDPGIWYKFENTPFEMVDIIHAVFPRSDFDPRMKDNKNKPYASCWICNNKLVQESGYADSPHTVWRWRTESDEVYGRSPGWDSLIEVRLSNQMGEDILDAADMALRPPYAVLEELRGRVQIVPKGRTYLQNMNMAPAPLASDMRGFPFSMETQARVDKAIESHFHTDFFLMLSRAAFEKINLTATQVLEMQGEKAAVLGSRIGALQTEFLNPIIDRMFSIERRAGRIPPIPDVLLEYSGTNIEIDYMGPLAQAQRRLFKTQNINAALSSVAPLLEVAPDVVRSIINWEETIRELLETNGMPQKCINNPKVVQQLIAEQQQAMKANQMATQIKDMSGAVPNVSKNIEPDSPLAMLLGKGEAAA